MFLLVPAYLGSPGQPAVKRLCVCVLYLAEVGVKHVDVVKCSAVCGT